MQLHKFRSSFEDYLLPHVDINLTIFRAAAVVITNTFPRRKISALFFPFFLNFCARNIGTKQHQVNLFHSLFCIYCAPFNFITNWEASPHIQWSYENMDGIKSHVNMAGVTSQHGKDQCYSAFGKNSQPTKQFTVFFPASGRELLSRCWPERGARALPGGPCSTHLAEGPSTDPRSAKHGVGNFFWWGRGRGCVSCSECEIQVQHTDKGVEVKPGV